MADGWEDVVERAKRLDLSGGNRAACRGCGTTRPLEPSPLTDAACDGLKVLPFMCPDCGRHAQQFDVRLWTVPLPPARPGGTNGR